MTRERWRARRVLHPVPLGSLADYVAVGGSAGIETARRLGPDATIGMVVDSGLRGRGGAGFPVGRKWRTVADERRRSRIPPVVVVNGAEGEPGTFKDRSIIRNNPYAVIEGAVIASIAVGASDVIVATKQSFEFEMRRLAGAIAEIAAAGCSTVKRAHCSNALTAAGRCRVSRQRTGSAFSRRATGAATSGRRW